MLAAVDVHLTIGEFSKMTHLSIKALRHYHDVGLLEPAQIDHVTGYRRYASNQVATAQVIRRFRELDMPIAEVRRVLQSSDRPARNRAILDHLDRMHAQLEQTHATVASLLALLTDDPQPPRQIEIRPISVTRVMVARATVSFDDCAAWLERALADLHGRADAAGVAIVGTDGALYPDEFFEAGAGEVTAFVPVAGDGVEVIELPARSVAVLRHDGPFADLDQAYGALGAAVAEYGIGGPGPIREHYLTATSTEVCWPVVTAGGGPDASGATQDG